MNGIIRKIIIGPNPKDAMAYYLGMRVGDGSVSTIVLDDEHLHRYGRSRYLIYIGVDGGQSLWKAIDGLPCLLEFDLNF
jgi:hypothetical protein